MLIVGLTGSIGMGKSTVAGFLRDRGIGVLDADAVVHALYAGEAAPLIEAAFPGTVSNGVVDRQALSALVLGKPDAMARLEAIVHPLVKAAQRSFLRAEAVRGASLAVLEIPLLFETGGDARVDVTMVVSAPAEVQRARVLARPGMTVEKLDAILARQMSDAEKRRRADVVIDTGSTLDAAREAVGEALATLATRPATAYQRVWAAVD